LEGDLQALQSAVRQKGEKIERKTRSLEEHRIQTFDQIDNFFEEVVEAARLRA
jgi:hypothetical protein